MKLILFVALKRPEPMVSRKLCKIAKTERARAPFTQEL